MALKNIEKKKGIKNGQGWYNSRYIFSKHISGYSPVAEEEDEKNMFFFL